MTLLFLDVQNDLNRRLGTYALLADIPSALAWAMREMSLFTSSAFTVSDSDLASVSSSRINQLLDLSEYRARVSITTNLNDDNLRQIGIMTLAKDVIPQQERLCKSKLDFITEKYKYGYSTLEGGVVSLDFTETLCRGGFSQSDDSIVLSGDVEGSG